MLVHVHVCLDLAGAKTVRGEVYGQATSPILLDDVKCRGTEENIFNCPQRQLGIPNNCQHSEDVGIQCAEQGMPIFMSLTLSEWV